MIYVITTFEKVDRNAGHWIKYGDTRTVGYYFNYEDALEVLTNNVCDLWEYCYDYAALEALPACGAAIKPVPASTIWPPLRSQKPTAQAQASA